MSEKNGFNLKAMQALTPKVNPVEAMRKQLALSVYDNVHEKDIAAMMTKLKEMALDGNLGAMKMFLKLTIGEGNDKVPEAPAESPGAAALARAVEDLVDEIRIARAEPPAGRRPALKGPRDDDDED